MALFVNQLAGGFRQSRLPRSPKYNRGRAPRPSGRIGVLFTAEPLTVDPTLNAGSPASCLRKQPPSGSAVELPGPRARIQSPLRPLTVCKFLKQLSIS